MNTTVYDLILQDVLEFSGGKRILSLSDVRAYTGLRDNRTIKRRFPMVGGTIAVQKLAAELARER